MTELDDHLAIPPEGWDPDPEQRERFVVDNDAKANWALRKLARTRAEKERLTHQAQQKIAHVETWLADVLGPLEHDEQYFTQLLYGYRLRLQADNPDQKPHYPLVDGRLILAAGSKSTRVTDDTEFTRWALDNAPETLSYKPLVSRMGDWPRQELPDGRVAIVDPETGEFVPGVFEVTGEERFEVRPADLSVEPF